MGIQRTSTSQQIANELRAQIESGELRPGDALPSDGSLAKRFDVSKPTITKARSMLVALGLVTSRAGAPSTVSVRAEEPASTNAHLHRARSTGRIYPAGHYAKILRAEQTAASPEVAAALGIEPGEPVVQRQRITYAADDQPLATSTSFFPAELADQCPALLQTERIPPGTTHYIEQQSGRVATSIAGAVAARPAGSGPESARELLDLKRASYVLALSTTTYDANGRAFAYEVELHPPETPISLDVVDVRPDDDA